MAKELSGNIKKVYDAMIKKGATSEEKAKGMEDIVREARIPKGAGAPPIKTEKGWLLIYEIRGEVPNVVFACGACEVRDKYYVYYGG